MFLLLHGIRLLAFASIAVVAATGRVSADDTTGQQHLVNLDGPSTAAKGKVAGTLDLRFFDHPEDIVYTSLGIRCGLLSNVEIGFRGATGTTKALPVPAGGAI